MTFERDDVIRTEASDMAKSFYVTLPSNGSMNVFPGNTVTEYKNKLPRPLHLDGEWEVGLVECTYPYSWFQISEETSHMYYRLPKLSMKWSPLPILNVKSIFNEEAIFREKWMESHHRPWLRFNGVNDNGQLKMNTPQNVELKLEGKITQTLGVPDPHVLTSEWEYGRYPWMKQNVHQLFVYTDIITPHPVGDREVPLLKQFSVTNLPDFGSPVDVVPPLVAYYPVNRNPIDAIEIALRDGTGQKIPFTSGRAITTLHFRQRRSAWL